MYTKASIGVGVCFVLLVFALLGWFVWAVVHAGSRLEESTATRRKWGVWTAIGLGGWLALTTALAFSGILRNFKAFPPPIMVMLWTFMLVVAVLSFTRFGARLCDGTGLAWLIGFQVFRFPLELILHRLYVEGVLPIQMSYSGWNFDILTGLSAPIVAWLFARGKLPRWGALLWNILGLGLLLNIVTIAILSLPLPFRMFHNEPANTFVTYAPYTWLPTVFVAMAFLGHFLTFRTLWRLRHTT